MAGLHERIQKHPLSQVVIQLAALVGGVIALFFFIGVGGRFIKKLG